MMEIQDKHVHWEITETIIQSFYKVYNRLGYGFLEKIYENALLIELKECGLECKKQKAISVFYQQQLVGEYFADIIVENAVIIELKAGKGIIEEHEAQLVNYLRATHMEVGLLLNFGKVPLVKRKAFSNKNKFYDIENGSF